VITVRAYAKVNLYLDVVSKRADGYHNIETIFQSVDLYDELGVRDAAAGVEVECAHPLVPGGTENLVYRAGRLLGERAGISRGARVTLVKRIPVGAGLGGGSADAAATLVGLNKLWDTPLADNELAEIARELGADVPFCLTGGTAAGTGIGDLLTPLPCRTGQSLLLVVPHDTVSTKEAYSWLEVETTSAEIAEGDPFSAKFDAVVSTYRDEGPRSVLYNRFERVVAKKHPEIEALRSALVDAGLQHVLMSGSGPAVFALVDEWETAAGIAQELSERYRFAGPCRFVDKGLELVAED